jgi:GDP-4-dehydro-6-deoxy-D-mannose reductase
MKKALIFGIAGVSGVYLGRELKENGYDVYGSDIKSADDNYRFDGFYTCDVTDFKAVKQLINLINPTHIFNLTDVGGVGQAWKNPQRMLGVNLTGTLNILEACKDFLMKPRILLVGSGDEYAPSLKMLDENSTLKSTSPYGISKIMQERLAEVYHDKYDMPIYCVRPFNHAGIGQNENFFVPMIAKQAAEIKKFNKEKILYTGNLKVSRDFLDVKDLVKGYRMVIESSKSEEIYNIGYGISYSLEELVKYIVGLTGMDIKIVVDGNLIRPSDNPYSCCDHSKITKLLGWEPQHNIYDTIKQVYEDYLNK